MQSAISPPSAGKEQTGSETSSDHSPQGWSKSRASSAFGQSSGPARDPRTPQTPRPFVFRPPSYSHKRPQVSSLSANTGFFSSPIVRPLFSLRSTQSLASIQSSRANIEAGQHPNASSNRSTEMMETPCASRSRKASSTMDGQLGSSPVIQLPTSNAIVTRSNQGHGEDDSASKVQQQVQETEDPDLECTLPAQSDDHQQFDTDSTHNSKVEEQRKLHTDVSSGEHYKPTLTDGSHEMSAPGSSLNREALLEQSASVARAVDFSSSRLDSRLDSRHQDLSRHLDSMFTDVALELQSKDVQINQLRAVLGGTKQDLDRIVQQNIELSTKEKDARLWNDRLQKVENDLRCEIQELQERNKELVQSGLDATEKIRLLEIDNVRMNANNKQLKEDVIRRIELIKRSCLEDEKALNEGSVEISSFHEQLLSLQGSVKEFRSHQVALGERVEIARQQLTEGKRKLVTKCEDLEIELASLMKAGSVAQGSLEVARERITALEGLLLASVEKANGLSTELEAKGNVVEAFIVNNAAMTNEIQLLSRSKDFEKETLQAQLSQLNDVYQEEVLDHTRTKSIMAILKSTLEETEKMYTSLKEISAKPECTVTSVSTSDDPQLDLHMQFIRLSAEFRDLESKIRDQTRQADAYTSLCASQQTINSTLTLELNASQRRCQDIAELLEEKSKDLQEMKKAVESSNLRMTSQACEIEKWKSATAAEKSKHLNQVESNIQNLKVYSDDIASCQAELKEQELKISLQTMEEQQQRHHCNLVQERQAHKRDLESLRTEIQTLANASRNVPASSNAQSTLIFYMTPI
ncbi:hypothetical protein EMPS_09040 [Entomortierella parvispora]|uniref:Uncharacterized protein n=1 Tax=Entomortierella parvispora TaxID=205924 RepID=A0A9P3HHH8_9FUNG|nr:hypothetical protein EMPS_09040 [Entomortierella parvispora]